MNLGCICVPFAGDDVVGVKTQEQATHCLSSTAHLSLLLSAAANHCCRCFEDQFECVISMS